MWALGLWLQPGRLRWYTCPRTQCSSVSHLALWELAPPPGPTPWLCTWERRDSPGHCTLVATRGIDPGIVRLHEPSTAGHGSRLHLRDSPEDKKKQIKVSQKNLSWGFVFFRFTAECQSRYRCTEWKDTHSLPEIPYTVSSQSTLVIFSQFHHDKSLNHNLPLSVRFNSDHLKSSPDICYIEMSWLNLPHYCMCDIWYSALHKSWRRQKREHVGELQGWMTKQTTANTNHRRHRLPGFQPTSFLLLLSAEVGILPQRCGSPQKFSHFLCVQSLIHIILCTCVQFDIEK